MLIKQPVCYDVSHWKEIPDFNALNPRPVLMITKATECYPGAPFNNTTDPTFGTYMTGMRRAGIRRGAFHFFRRQYDALRQAKHFVGVVSQYITPDDILALDFEEGGETAAQLLIFLEYVRYSFPMNIIMNYSRANIMNNIQMTAAQRERMTGYPSWVAGYPYDPDQYEAVPSFYVPDPSRWGVVWLWQYTDRASVDGISGGVDANWMHSTLQKLIGGDMPSQDGEPMSNWYRVNASVGLNIRKGPGTNYQDLGDLLRDDVVESVQVQSGWHRIVRWFRGTTEQTLPDPDSSWCAGAYLTATTPPVEEPTEPEPPAVHPVSGTVEVTLSDGSVWRGTAGEWTRQ